jgi:DNA-binding transcriptional MerR regulator
MLGLSAATIRTWETRYGTVEPARSEGGQRLYSLDQVEHLRLVKRGIADGRRPAEAHRLLAERLARGDSFEDTQARVLLAERSWGAVAALRELLGTERFEVLLAPDPATAQQVVDELEPALVLIDTDDAEFQDLSRRLREAGKNVLPVVLLERPLALAAEARSMLAG